MKRTSTATFTAAALVVGSSIIGFGANEAHAAPMSFLADTLSDNAADGYTLREALADADANPGPDTVGFVSGLSGTLAMNGVALNTNDSVTIEGPADGSITIDALGTSRVINSFFPGSDLTIRNLTLRGGDAGIQGGAVAVYQGNDIVIESVNFENNATAGSGGAVSIGSITGSVDIVDSVFDRNEAVGSGGALHIFEHDNGGSVTIERTSFVRNTSTGGSGGAMWAELPTSYATFNDVVIDRNEAATRDDGGLHLTARFVQMDGVAITNNTAKDENGGAMIRSTEANVNIINTDISANTAFSVGGATILSASFINFNDNVVRSNSATSAAGLRLTGDGGVNLRHSTVELNEATSIVGGLMVIDTPQLVIEEATIQDNRAASVGGIYLGNVADAEVDYTTVARNVATVGGGGGIAAAGVVTDRLVLSNSTVSTNSAATEGGGIHVTDVEVSVLRSTVVENTAGSGGGGVFQGGLSAVTIDTSIVTHNASPTFENVNGPVSVMWSLLGDTSGTAFIAVNDNLPSVDPLLGPLGDNGGPTATHLPAASSPVIDAGDPGVVPLPTARDQRGAGRFSGEYIDIGAVERNSGDGSIWTPLPPARVVDTRSIGVTVDGNDQADGPLVAASQTTFDIAGRAGIPDNARGVVANVTAVRPDGRGFLTAHPCADQLPLAASLNYEGGVTLGNEIIIGLDDTGALCVFTSAQTHVTIDVVGYIGADSVYVPTEPARFLETRAGQTTIDGESQAIGRLAAGDTVEVNVRNRGDIDIDAQAAVMYVTAIRPDDVGFLTIWNCDTEMPLASSLNYVSGSNRGNEVVMKADLHESKICVFASSAVDLTIDVVGFVPDLSNNHESLDSPARLLDSRPEATTIDGEFAGDGRRPSGSTLELQVGGRAGIPATAATVTMNLTAVRPAGIGYVTAFPCGGEPPLTASVNHVDGVSGGNEIVAALDDSGRVCLFTSAETHLTADITGYTQS